MDQWDPQKILDVYILDYMRKKGVHRTADIFVREANVCDKPVVINPPEGFLKEWWDIFFDIFSSRQPRNSETREESSSQRANRAMGNVLQNVCPAIPRPGMIQMGNFLQNVCPIMPKPEMNRLMVGQFPNSSDFNMMQGQALLPVFAAPAQMYGQDNFRLSARDMNSSPQLLDVEKLNRMLPPSSSSSHLQHQIPKKSQQRVALDNRRIINLGRPIPMEPTPRGTPKAVRPRIDPPDAGKNKDVKLTTSTGWPLTGARPVFPSTPRPHVLNGFIPTPNQQQKFSAFASHRQDVVLSEAAALASGKMISSASGSSRIACHPMSVNDDLTWKYLIKELPMQQPPEQQVSVPVKQTAEHMIISKTQTARQQIMDQLKEQCPNENSRKRKMPSNSLAVESAMSRKDAEEETPMDENAESFLSHNGDTVDNMSTPIIGVDHRSSPCDKIEQKGFSLSEICSLHGSKNKVLCCHFSSNGKLLASAGHEPKVLIWNLETYSTNIMEGHSNLITDIRFRPNSTVFATSSFDRSVHIWDASRLGRSLFKLTGHAEHVMSLDFHPRKVDLLCSCDTNDEIRMWNINQGVCTHIFKGANRQVRFQPRLGGLLAAATGNVINVINVGTGIVQYKLEGHAKDVHSICWDISGKYIASVSEDSARIWSTTLGGKSIHELHSSGNKFESCIFHPGYTQLLVIGSYQSLHLWNPTDHNKTWTYHAHNGVIASLAASPQTRIIASASHDQWIKLWR